MRKDLRLWFPVSRVSIILMRNFSDLFCKWVLRISTPYLWSDAYVCPDDLEFHTPPNAEMFSNDRR